jgi:hypothetical protein
MTRVDFLVSTYGIENATEGACRWPPLVSRAVLQALLVRCSKTGPASRYQLQRLFRRATNAARPDLLLPILQFADLWYPAPSSASIQKAEPTNGFNPEFPDEELFAILAGANEVPEGLKYLVKEGMESDWAVLGDDVMTALLTKGFIFPSTSRWLDYIVVVSEGMRRQA